MTQHLKDRAKTIRDATDIGQNTAYVVGSVLCDIIDSISSGGDITQEQAAAIENLSKQIHAEVDRAKTAENANASKISTNANNIQSNLQSIASNKKSISELSSKITSNTTKISTVSDEVDDLKKRLSTANNNIDKVSEDVSTNRKNITSLRNSLNTIIGAEDTTKAIDTFNEIVKFLASFEKTDTLESIIAGLNKAIAEKYDKNEAVKELSAIRAIITANENKITNLTNIQEEHGTAISSLSSRMDEAEGSINSILSKDVYLTQTEYDKISIKDENKTYFVYEEDV